MSLKQKIIYLFASCLVALYLQTAKAEVIVLVNTNVAAESLSATSLSRIFAMQIRSWPNGQPIKVFTFSPDSPVFKKFAIDKARIQPHQLDRLWKRLLFTGTGRTPVIVNSHAEMIQSIRQNPGAIGYINLPQDYMGLKVVEVISDEN